MGEDAGAPEAAEDASWDHSRNSRIARIVPASDVVVELAEAAATEHYIRQP